MEHIFKECSIINNLLLNNDNLAREHLIKLLDYCKSNKISYTPLINALIRATGLYPYLDYNSSNWQEKFVYESFKINIGNEEPVTLHRQQSLLLKKLLDGKNIAVSAPTSFGKSFIIDAFISLNKPKNVMLIVPTLALTDESRRRIYKKFSSEYKIITTTEATLSEKNIFIFPQERALTYVNKIDFIDILIIDEFYKASLKFDKQRSPSLLRLILKLNKKSKQKYFLAPNIRTLNDNFFTKGMEFISLDFNTVFLEKNNLYNEINNKEEKGKIFIKLLRNIKSKSLIYAGTYSNIVEISKIITANFKPEPNNKLTSFKEWLISNYVPEWQLIDLISRATGIHNGQLHRSLSQIQIKLFEDEDGLKNIVSTSSIIEGVNTSAENIIVWSNKNGIVSLNDFTYKNIIGRGGRMFKHFIGKIFILEEPPKPVDEQLSLEFSDKIIFDINEKEHQQELTQDQIATIITYKREMSDLLSEENYQALINEGSIENSDAQLLLKIARSISGNPEDWKRLNNLNSSNPVHWHKSLYKILKINGVKIGVPHKKLVNFICNIYKQWDLTFPTLMKNLEKYSISIDDFFKLERILTYNLASLLNDINTLQNKLIPEYKIDISPFIFKISYAFLPPIVFQLEEYGLPRMISKKIQNSQLIDLTNKELDLYSTIDLLNTIGLEKIIGSVHSLHPFDEYILKYFFDGISK